MTTKEEQLLDQYLAKLDPKYKKWNSVMNIDEAQEYILYFYKIQPFSIYCSIPRKTYKSILKSGFNNDFPIFHNTPFLDKNRLNDIVLLCFSTKNINTINNEKNYKDVIIVGRFIEVKKKCNKKHVKSIQEAYDYIIKNNITLFGRGIKEIYNKNNNSALLTYHGTSYKTNDEILKNNYFNRKKLISENLTGNFYSFYPQVSYVYTTSFKKYTTSGYLYVNIIIVSNPSPSTKKWTSDMILDGKYDISIGEDEIRTYDNKKTYIIGKIKNIILNK